jgi:TonB family protein
MGVLPLLTAPGETSSSPLADLLAAGAVDRPLEEAMRGVSAVQIAGDTSLAHLPPVRGTGKVGVVEGLRGSGPIAAATETDAVAERRARADLRVGPPEVASGKADPQAIAGEIRGRRKAIAACYERALKQQPTLAGKLVVRFTIAPAGTVVSVEIDEDALGAPAVAACVRAVILRWRFTAAGNEPVEVSFPFVFQAGA